jgi:hypothetical protein
MLQWQLNSLIVSAMGGYQRIRALLAPFSVKMVCEKTILKHSLTPIVFDYFNDNY